MTDDMIVATICREFKWTYQEFMESPAVFIDNVMIMMRAEAKQERIRERMSKMNSKN